MVTSRTRLAAAAVLAASVLVGACGDRGAGPTAGGGATHTPVVYVTSYPLAYFAGRIGGDAVKVVFPVPAGDDPAWWHPGDDAIAACQQADLILLNGATYEKWVEKASLPPARTVDTTKQVADRFLPMKGVVTHSHGPEGAHEHRGTAFTTWLDLGIATAQAQAVEAALARLVPGASAAMAERLGALEKDLAGLDAALRAAVAQDPQRPVVFSHPVYQYLAAAYGVNGEEVHWEPGEMPPDEAWRAFDELRERTGARWMIWEAAPDAAIVARLEERGVRSVVFEPCGNRPATGDFLAAMRRNVESLKTAYAEP